ncbi:MAG: glucokinase [Clostridiales bacterium]|nr:glucokinase [Clostridiales bacterium]
MRRECTVDIGIDLGGTNIAIGLVDDQGHIIYKDSVPTNASRHYSEIIRDMFYLSEKVVQDAGYQLKDINTVGVGSPGIPDKEKGMILYANNLNFYNVPLKEEIQKMMNLPIFIDNDANCAAYAEAMVGAAKDVASSVTITLGTGIGSGVIIDNQIYSGFKGAGGELGHIVIQIGGEQCTCGRKGCWERYGSATALILQTKKAAKENPQSVIHELVNGNLDKINGKTAFDANWRWN